MPSGSKFYGETDGMYAGMITAELASATHPRTLLLGIGVLGVVNVLRRKLS